MRTCCPSCGSKVFKKNGINQHGDQNHKCLECQRQFVLNPQNKIIIEGVNCILRQRVSRLVRKTVAFSKQFANHVKAIRYFFSHYNQWTYEKFVEKWGVTECFIT